MSLINDALKKAQTLQTHGSPRGAAPSATAAGARSTFPTANVSASTPLTEPPPLRRGRNRTSLVIALGAGGFIGVIAMLGVVVYLLFARAAEATRVAAHETTPAASVPAPSSAAQPQSAASTSATPPAVSFSIPSPTATAAAPTNSAPKTSAASSRAPAPSNAATPPAATSAPAEPVAVGPDPRIQAFVAAIQVAGIRAGANAKALMNDRVYAIGDIVNVEFALRLKTIAPRMLTFEDAAGNSYELRF